ncbi:MAG TPA: DUF488 domain-containing protein [Thermotogae bacterium]|nr:hypothetical protein [Thermotogota bacterium]HCZ07032.1 DUF488 domain-containing protein [Thermotogota bacterium]
MIFTVGYEGRSIAEFLELLKTNGVETVIDVRELPMSRKPGFSKNRLQKIREEEGIEYVSAKQLGNPYRRSLKSGEATWEEVKPLFEEYIRDNLDAVEEVVKMSRSKNVCLLCFEKDPNACHRSVIASIIEKDFGLKVAHL